MTIVEKSGLSIIAMSMNIKPTDADNAEIAQKIADGSYFEEARKWYNILYIGPISERIFFIIITIIAIAITVFATLSVINLLPIKPRIPFVYRAKDFIGEIPNMIRLKQANDVSNPALIRYYLSTYVSMRESYDEDRFLMRWAFMRYYNDARTFQEYDRLTNPNNPRSPIRRYGKYADVAVTIDSVEYVQNVTPYRATVNFSTEVIGTDQKKKTNWTATLGFEYTDLMESSYYSEKYKDYVLEYKEPTFRVVSYDVRERLVMEK
jgi:type IV secretory pathway component VirB8